MNLMKLIQKCTFIANVNFGAVAAAVTAIAGNCLCAKTVQNELNRKIMTQHMRCQVSVG